MESERHDAYPHLGSEGQLSRSVLEIDGMLQITGTGGESIAVSGEGSRIRADIGSLATGRPTLRLIGSSLVLARRLAKALARRELTLLITRSGTPLIELGSAARGGFLERLLRMPRVRLYRRK